MKHLSPGLDIQVLEDENYKLHLKQAEKEETMGLWQVICVTQRWRGQTKLIPSTTMMYVLAEDEECAIGQVEEATGDRDNTVSTATRIPLYVRGWGLSTF